MESLLQRQQILAEAIDKVGINFNKDSGSRKNSEYLKKRVDALDEYWQEFEANNTQLLAYDSKGTDYVISNAYERVKSRYEKLRNVILTYPERNEDRGTPSRSDELIMQQSTNFRALSRLIRNIDIENISETWEVEDKLQMLQARWKIIDDVHWQIDNLLVDMNVNYEQEFTNYESKYESIKRLLHRKLNSTTAQNQSLPKIEIPTFSGNYAQWPTFLDLYKETIHNNTSLSKAQKMQHLKGKLRGEAEKLVQHLAVSTENYNTCWDILTHRYDNKQLLFTKQIQTFMSQPAIQQQSAYELKRLHDTSMETIYAIHNLGVDTTTWDPILVHILTGKLDSETYTSYMEMRKAPRDLPVFDEFIEFLENKFTALEPVNKKKQQPAATTFTRPSNYTAREPSTLQQKGTQNKHARVYPRTYHVSAERSCPLCKANHILISCKTFQSMSPDDKLTTISQLNICQNCLYSHDKQCASKKTCRVCNLTHHTSLHDALRVTKQAPSSSLGQQPPRPNCNQVTPSVQPSTNHVAGNYNEVLLATLQLQVKAIDGTYITLRCLLDQGSQINLITESAAQRLGLPRSHENASVFGIGTSNNQSNGTVKLHCVSLSGDYTLSTDALVMKRVLNNLPNFSFEKQQWSHLQGISLADPDYNISRPVDILLDAGVYAEIATGCMLRGPVDAPIALQTKVGWVLFGNMKTYNCHAIIHNLDDISLFWELEDITTNNSSKQMTSDEARCETLYANTTRRLDDGRYEVKIPMNQNYQHCLGDSMPQAVAQFRQLEKRLIKNEELSNNYKAFIAEYISLGHMKLSTIPREPSCFLPHHGVLRPESTTTKLRVVFNASSNTSSGYSLNQLMECGPNLQQDLQSMILRWRSYQYVYTADIEKFYRQILIAEEDQHLQKIVWRDSTVEPIKEYQLCTVTYGTKSAPFLAMRTIKQLIMDDGKDYPLAAEILNHQLYVDDLLAGSNSIEEAQIAQKQLIDMLKGGGFNIRKWASNNPTLLENLPDDLISQNMFNFQQAESNKTLGISWNPQTDYFTFRHGTTTDNDVITKRTLLSDISKLYDPLGWLSPVTMKAKLMFQRAWIATSSWDEPLPECVQQEWKQLHKELPTIREMAIRRWIGTTQNPIELHGFCDASEKGYGCVIYCISINKQGKKVTELVAGKSKLTPLNKPTTLPRLELCGALLLARLMKKVTESIKAQTVTTHGWTDSMVVLGWLQGQPSRWKTFVANRVIQITELMPPTCWRHVKSEDNAADCASRGLSPSQLQSFSLWWEGPTWLKGDDQPPENIFETREEERKQPQVCMTQSCAPLVEELLQTHSSMARVTRVLSWIVRFIKNVRDTNHATRTSHLTPSELKSSLITLVKAVQHNSFIEEISQLQKQNRVSSSSKIINLNPSLDQDGLLRVGGRLERAELDHAQKHPMILPNKHKLTQLLIEQAHKTTLHGGARLTLQYLRTKYWIIGGMKTVKRHITNCVKCHRYSKRDNNQLMADLPKPRVNPSRPFTHTGVDFTGQVDVKANKGRGIKTMKAYIAVFICLCTKAIHLELVSDLSTAAFIASLKRLCARRGTPKHMYSDNGTNFVGAARTLTKERDEALKLYVNNEFLDFTANSGIEWHFNAPSWPTAGGLWEAAVKSLKHHLKRVLGEQRLTYEEFSTLLTQIEACLNSRPLMAITEDPEDLDCLTPGHFLIGGPLLGPPLGFDNDSTSLTTRWRQTEKMLKDFWKKWSTSYLQTLQTRSKWFYPTENIEIGNLVLVRDDNIPPARWLMGRVTETHPGADGRVRVVTLKTKTSNNVKRPVTKLSRLPIDCVAKEPTNTQGEPSNTEPPKRQLRPRKGAFTNYLCTLLLLIATCITPASPQPINVTALNPTKLIYFDKLTDMKVIQDKWTMVVYYNMSTYWQSFDNLEKYINQCTGLSKHEVAYQALITQLQHDLNELKHNNDVLQTEHGRRTKRGLINGIGYVANSLFGVLDERFAEKYHKDIKRIQINENHILNLYKNHTSIIESEYNLLKRNEEVFNKQITTINQHLQQIENKVQKDESNTQYIIVTALAANMILSNLRNVQQLLLDLVTDIRSGRMDTHLLTPEELETQLNIIGRQIPNGLTLPCTISYECTRLVYKISRVHVRLTNKYLIFEVKIPLVATEIYELSRVLPINIKHEKSVVHVIPTAEYVAVDQKRNLLITLTSKHMSQCLQANEYLLLCDINLPIHDIRTTQSICEAQIISRKVATSCRTEASDCKIEWIQLHSRGSWLFTCCEECTTSIFCPAEEVTSQVLRNTGIVTLPDGCMLQGDDHVIHSHTNFHSEVHLNQEYNTYIPHSGINKFLPTNNITGINFSPESHDLQFKTLKEKIEAVKRQQEMTNLTYDDDDVHHYIMYGFIVLCFVALGFWLSLKIRQRRQNQNQEIELATIATSTAASAQLVNHVTRTVNDDTAEPALKVDKATSPVPYRAKN